MEMKKGSLDSKVIRLKIEKEKGEDGKATKRSAKCSGCRTCEYICAEEHFNVENPSKSAIRVSGENFPNPGGYTIHQCNQCGKCAKECPAEAIYKNEKTGAYIIDKDKCIGCTKSIYGDDKPTCVAACPIDAIFTHPDVATPIKCDLCNGEPKCAGKSYGGRCPMDAIEVEIKPDYHAKEEPK